MSEDLKSCCATLYESDFARLLLGDSFHPGGLRLTERLGELMELGPGLRVLDVASGKGESAIFLARHFGCEVVGIDFGLENIRESAARASDAGIAQMVQFRQGDAEKIDFPTAEFDAVICECAFCTFPDKPAAAAEFARILKPGGRVGLSDLTRSDALPAELEGLLAWIACIADARPAAEYVAYLEAAGITGLMVEPHDEALAEMVRDIQGKLLGAELMSKLKKLNIEGVDFAQAKALARAAADAVRAGALGYAIVTGQRV
jgi:ubiquinone/menaquinone biosynthesis C-methylase UbiE